MVYKKQELQEIITETYDGVKYRGQNIVKGYFKVLSIPFLLPTWNRLYGEWEEKFILRGGHGYEERKKGMDVDTSVRVALFQFAGAMIGVSTWMQGCVMLSDGRISIPSSRFWYSLIATNLLDAGYEWYRHTKERRLTERKSHTPDMSDIVQ